MLDRPLFAFWLVVMTGAVFAACAADQKLHDFDRAEECPYYDCWEN